MLVERFSLTDQVAGSLREGISSGRWRGQMPSEAELCRELSISRTTLRKAFEHLVGEGWIASAGRGRHHRITKRARRSRTPTGKIVRVLSPYPLQSLGSAVYTLLDTIGERLGKVGVRQEYECRPSLFNRKSPAGLRRFVSLPDTAAFLVLFATRPMQQWLSDNRIPCVILGRTYEGVQLPSFYSDAPALSNHAAGLFFQQGHRNMAYFIARFTSLNDRMAAQEFVEEAGRLGGHAEISVHGADRDAVIRGLDRVLAKNPRPTAFYSTCAEHCLTILCHLLARGLRVPADASIVSGVNDTMLDFAVPRFTGYQLDGAKAAARVFPLLLAVIRKRQCPLVPVRYLCTYTPGETLGPAPG